MLSKIIKRLKKLKNFDKILPEPSIDSLILAVFNIFQVFEGKFM